MRGCLTVWILVASGSLGGVAVAQQDVLRGPKVEDAGPPGVPEKFGEAMQRPAGEAGQRVPMRAYTRALRSLRDAGDESLRLSPAQADSIREVMLAYRDDVREALAQRNRPANGKAAPKPAASDAEAAPGRPDRRSQRARAQGEQEGAMRVDAMRSLSEAMPDAASYQRRVWEVLTADQQALVEQALEAELEILRNKRAERMAEMASTGRDRAADAARQRLRSMTPEQRRELMQRQRDRSRLERDHGEVKKSGKPTNNDTWPEQGGRL